MLKSIMLPLAFLFGLLSLERSTPIVAAPVDLVIAVPVAEAPVAAVDSVVEVPVVEAPVEAAEAVVQHLQLEFGAKKTKSKHLTTTNKSKKEQTKKKRSFKSKEKSKSKNHTSTFSHANSTSHLTGPPQYR